MLVAELDGASGARVVRREEFFPLLRTTPRPAFARWVHAPSVHEWPRSRREWALDIAYNGAERACIEGIERRRNAAKPKAAMSAARERAIERVAFARAGGDVTSSEWTDRLASAGGRNRKLRYHRAG